MTVSLGARGVFTLKRCPSKRIPGPFSEERWGYLGEGTETMGTRCSADGGICYLAWTRDTVRSDDNMLTTLSVLVILQ